MGRRDKTYSIDLHTQAYNKLTSMQAFGESKKEAIANGTDRDKIFSFNTYQTYWKHTKYFLGYVREHHPDCTTLRSAQKYVGEWLQSRVDQGLSAWTIQTEAKALGKLYGIQPGDKDYFEPPKRERQNITRSRVDRVRDKHFSVTNNDELIKFCKGTGVRRSELVKMRGSDLITREKIESEIARIEALPARSPEDEKNLAILKDTRLFPGVDKFLRIRGKGGRNRISPILGPHAAQIIERIERTAPDKKVWEHVNTNADIHSYRGDYATMIYREYAREISKIPYDRVNSGTGKPYQSDVYVCRKDEAGRKLDKAAMLLASKALGHNRIEVVANNYIRGL